MSSPSGVSSFKFISTVSDASFEAASFALDRALLRVIGLPEEVEIREFENSVTLMIARVKVLINDFSLSKVMDILPLLIEDGAQLWVNLEPKVSGKIERKDFITKLIRYVYKRVDPNIPILPEPFESLTEEILLSAIPSLVDYVENLLDKNK
jgi:hypothetical protein